MMKNKLDIKEAVVVYDKILTRLVNAMNQGLTVSFVTLTSSYGSDVSKIWEHFDELVECMNKELTNDVEFVAVHTKEKQGVIHVLFIDSPFFAGWFQNNWSKIHSAYVISKSFVDVPVRIARYFVNQKGIVAFRFSGGW